MKNTEQQKKVDQTKKTTYFAIWDWIILIGAIIMLSGCIIEIVAGGLTIILSSKIDNSAQLMGMLFWTVISIWILKLELKKFKKTKTTKTYKIVTIAIWIVISLLTIPIIFSILTIYNNAEKTISSNSQIEIAIDFKNLSSDKTVNEINQLSPNAQIVAYKKHSALIEEVGQVWLQNLQGDNFELAVSKTLPILLTQGWTEESARDALSWMTSKSFIILGRDPERWCDGHDCKKQSDEEIKTILREDKSLSETVISGIFQELKIDSDVY